MALSISPNILGFMLDGITSAVTSMGYDSAKIEIYDGVVPTTYADALSGNNLLVSIPLTTTTLFPATNGSNAYTTANFDSLPATDTTAVGTGTASFFRIMAYLSATPSNNVTMFQGQVATDSSKELQLASLTITSGTGVKIDSMSISMV